MNQMDKEIDRACRRFYTPSSMIEFYEIYPEAMDILPKEQASIYQVWMISKAGYEAGVKEVIALWMHYLTQYSSLLTLL